MKAKFLFYIACSLIFWTLPVFVFGQTKISKPMITKEKATNSLIGKWASDEATVEIFENGTLTINGNKFSYEVIGKVIIVEADDGQIEFPFTLKGDTLTVLFQNRKIVYIRSSNDEEIPVRNRRNNSNSNPQELVGTWCYQADVRANNGGGRHSRICFTLHPNGTYEYQSGSDNSNPYGGSTSQSSDYGRWSATATTLTAHSNNGETRTYTLEKRNHPKNNDPMLIVDGDAFVTQFQKRPW